MSTFFSLRGIMVRIMRHVCIAEWLGQMFQGWEIYCHVLEVVGSNPSRVELGVCSTSV